MRVVVAGGGTAGHVFPGLALARTLSERGHEVTFVGTEHGVEATLVPAAGFELAKVPARPLVRRLSIGALRAPLVALAATRRSADLVRGAAAVVGMGGYVSVPAAAAARLASVPVVLHEQNAIPGLANTVLSRAAAAVALSFAEAAPKLPRGARRRAVVTGNPVRGEILRVLAERDRLSREGYETFGLYPGRTTIVVFGGSQGALRINRAAVGAACLLSERSDLQVLLITGRAHLEPTSQALPREPDDGGGLRVRAMGYVDRMELAYAISDLVVARAGATTIAEITGCGLPALLVPYPHATAGHQEANARVLQRRGAATVVLDHELTPESFAERVRALVDAHDRLRTMRAASAAAGRPDAAERLADVVERVARR